MDTQHIEDMILILEGSGASELEVSNGDSLVRIVKSHRSVTKKTPKKKPIHDETRVLQTASHQQEDLFITAPMVGIFHFDNAGIGTDHNVSVGQIVGAIESMKIHNELISRVAGIIDEVLVEDGTPVEYGQPLFRVVPTEL